MGLFGKSKQQKLSESIANQVLSAYQQVKKRTEKNTDVDEQTREFDTLYKTARFVISDMYGTYGATPIQTEQTLEECAEKFRQHLMVGATIGLVDVCTISHGCSMGLQESYTRTMNRYIQILYKLDVLRFDIEGVAYPRELEQRL